MSQLVYECFGIPQQVLESVSKEDTTLLILLPPNFRYVDNSEWIEYVKPGNILNITCSGLENNLVLHDHEFTSTGSLMCEWRLLFENVNVLVL